MIASRLFGILVSPKALLQDPRNVSVKNCLSTKKAHLDWRSSNVLSLLITKINTHNEENTSFLCYFVGIFATKAEDYFSLKMQI